MAVKISPAAREALEAKQNPDVDLKKALSMVESGLATGTLMLIRRRDQRAYQVLDFNSNTGKIRLKSLEYGVEVTTQLTPQVSELYRTYWR